MARIVPVLFLLCALTAARPAAADDGGPELTFSGAAISQVIRFGSGAAGAVLWESGPSDAISSDFDSLLFQGVLDARGVRFEASLRGPEGWGAWKKAAVERFPNGRFWARIPLDGTRGAVVRMRALSEGPAAAGALELYSLEANSPMTETTGAAPPPGPIQVPAAGTAPKPLIYPREAWGALPPEQPYEPMIPDRITVHHTEAAQPMSMEDAIQELRIIQRFHQRGRGWIDIGYHFLIDGSGRIWQGRPETVVGAHVRDKNEGNVGISIMGDFHPPKNQRPTRAQIRSLILLARWLVSAYGIDPTHIKGHRDQEDTSCPGDILYARLDEIRAAVAAPEPPAPADVAAGWRTRPDGEPAARVLTIQSDALGKLSGSDAAGALEDLFDTGRAPVRVLSGGDE